MMENNDELSLAWRFIENTGRSLFLTGKAGTGKTTFLKHLCEESQKRIVVLAPTGIAAINAGGVTIHSFFQLPLAPFVPASAFKSGERRYQFSKNKRNIIRSLDLLIIDEISMVRADLLDAVDDVLRKFRNHNRPFGGVQLLMIGDIQQLAPVVKDSEWDLLRNYYSSPYFFDSNALKHSSYCTIELKTVYRQQDSSFLDILNSIRDNKADVSVLNALNKRYIPGFKPREEDGYIRLTTHNNQAQKINESELAKLPGKEYSFKAFVGGDFPEYSYPADEVLTLKKGAQVMFLKNDTEHRYFNGMIGTVTHVDDKSLTVFPKEGDEELSLDYAEWSNCRYTLDEKTNEIKEEELGIFKQLPVKLAWAITIHKSQGLTFDHAIIDAHLSFAHGQTYVALSRCRTLEGIVLDAPLTPAAIIADHTVEAFSKDNSRNISDGDQLTALEHEYTLNIIRELFDFTVIDVAYDSLYRLINDSLYRQYPKTLELFRKHKIVLKTIMSVSAKFQPQYSALLREAGGDITYPKLQERIRSGAEYFGKQLSIITDLLCKSKMKTDNKTTEKSLKNRTQLLADELKVKIATLIYAVENEEDFTVSGYLYAKNMASIDGKQVAKKKKKEVVERINTKQVSYDLYLQGKSISEIAAERKLTKVTIENHLAHYVTTGDIPVEKLVDFDKYNRIVAYIKSHADNVQSLSVIREALGNNVSYSDIKFTIAAIQSDL